MVTGGRTRDPNLALRSFRVSSLPPEDNNGLSCKPCAFFGARKSIGLASEEQTEKTYRIPGPVDPHHRADRSRRTPSHAAKSYEISVFLARSRGRGRRRWSRRQPQGRTHADASDEAAASSAAPTAARSEHWFHSIAPRSSVARTIIVSFGMGRTLVPCSWTCLNAADWISWVHQ